LRATTVAGDDCRKRRLAVRATAVVIRMTSARHIKGEEPRNRSAGQPVGKPDRHVGCTAEQPATH
jgi:hypothetical protein